ncbi:MAG TPA: DUF4381 family protein [Verrucomicrobiota bacterium]|jgi:hypothetical protein|nr:DUF4381 family protein [Verrucomicrobiota bacterium]HQL76762.1 DUF4381 family protein [Verrucomicrobiota bacterium]
MKKEEGRRKKGLRAPRRLSLPGLWSLAPLCSALLILCSSFLVLAAATSPPSADDLPPLRPPHAELPPTFWEQHSLWVIVAGIFLLGLAGAAAWLLTRPHPPAAVPPEVQARQTLEALRHQPEDGALLSRVSQTLRHYVHAAFDLPPGELTTTEFCRAVAGHGAIGPELSTALGEFLRACDRHKFSPPAPVPSLGAVSRALQLIEQAEARRAQLRQAAPDKPAA